MKGLVDIFVLIIFVIVVGGLLMGIYLMLILVGFFWEGYLVVIKYFEVLDLVDFINIIVNVLFVFLFVLFGFLVICKFGGNLFLGVVFGMFLVYFVLVDGWNYVKILMEGNIKYWNVFGLEIEKVGY